MEIRSHAGRHWDWGQQGLCLGSSQAGPRWHLAPCPAGARRCACRGLVILPKAQETQMCHSPPPSEGTVIKGPLMPFAIDDGRAWTRASFPILRTTCSISALTGHRIAAAGGSEKPRESGENRKQRPSPWLLKETALPSIPHACCSHKVGKKRERYLSGFFNFDFVRC